MKATCWHRKMDVRVQDVPDPDILNPHDAIVKVTLTAICGSDLHLYNGYIPAMMPGDILGHEFMGVVVETGKEVKNLDPGDRVVVPFPIACGKCHFCKKQLFSLCENTNPNAPLAEKMWGRSPAGIFGYSHMLGGYAGGQAEYVRVPFADVGPMRVPDDVSDEQALFLSDIFPTGWMAAENCDLQRDSQTVAVWGAGPVGQFAIRSAFILGAKRVIAIDRFPERLDMAREGGAETINYEEQDIFEVMDDWTGGRGPDACIDAVGMEGHAPGIPGAMDRVLQETKMETDRPPALRQALRAVRNGGTVSVAGVYGGFLDKVPFGSIVNKGLTLRSGQTHVHKYMKPLLERIQKKEIDPSFVITHRLRLDDAAVGYELFKNKVDDCIKVVLKP